MIIFKEISMNKTVLAIIVCSMFARPASADTISGGKITSVNAGGTSFNYSKKKKHWTFWLYGERRLWAGISGSSCRRDRG
jgi:hypothetical protein